MIEEEVQEIWAIIQLMGHVTFAGRFSKSVEYPGLLQVDIPIGDTFHTKLFGAQAVYLATPVSEEIARLHDQPTSTVFPLDIPFISMEDHERAVLRLQDLNSQLSSQVGHLQRELGRLREQHQAAECGTVGLDEDDEPDPIEDDVGPGPIESDGYIIGGSEEDDIPF